MVGAGVKQVFPLGVPAGRGCAAAHRPVHETVSGGADRRLADASQHPAQPRQSIGGNGRDPWLPHPSKLGKESPFPGVQWVAAGIHIQADPWVGPMQESGPFLGVHNKGGLAVRPCP